MKRTGNRQCFVEETTALTGVRRLAKIMCTACSTVRVVQQHLKAPSPLACTVLIVWGEGRGIAHSVSRYLHFPHGPLLSRLARAMKTGFDVGKVHHGDMRGTVDSVHCEKHVCVKAVFHTSSMINFSESLLLDWAVHNSLYCTVPWNHGSVA